VSLTHPQCLHTTHSSIPSPVGSRSVQAYIHTHTKGVKLCVTHSPTMLAYHPHSSIPSPEACKLDGASPRTPKTTASNQLAAATSPLSCLRVACNHTEWVVGGARAFAFSLTFSNVRSPTDMRKSRLTRTHPCPLPPSQPSLHRSLRHR
jgi:hypothetical protein